MNEVRLQNASAARIAIGTSGYTAAVATATAFAAAMAPTSFAEDGTVASDCSKDSVAFPRLASLAESADVAAPPPVTPPSPAGPAVLLAKLMVGM